MIMRFNKKYFLYFNNMNSKLLLIKKNKINKKNQQSILLN